MDGVLLELDENTGNPVWEFVAGSSFVASPSVASGRLLIGTTDGFLYCFGEKEAE
jgi:outer membrane protein assembly factor BamB